MPIYEYECRKCRAVFDCIVLNVSKRTRPKCTRCGSTAVKKLVSRVRYVAGPSESGLAQNAENRMMKSFGRGVSEQVKDQIKKISKEAASRGKRRYESMMDTGKSENKDY